jgi:hypothetical protein
MPIAGAVYESAHPSSQGAVQSEAVTSGPVQSSPALDALGKLAVKGRAPKTGYARTQFSDGWGDAPGCNVRNYILKRDMTGVITKSETDCTVVQGNLQDPYTGKAIMFVNTSSQAVQIDHVVALSNAWQTGAQQLSVQDRFKFANDPLNLLAVDGPTNNKKGDGDAATWLPPNKDYRCRYVARQIAVKQKYMLWVTQAEHDAMQRVLGDCPEQLLPVESNS